jgi:hypothetical protein
MKIDEEVKVSRLLFLLNLIKAMAKKMFSGIDFMNKAL